MWPNSCVAMFWRSYAATFSLQPSAPAPDVEISRHGNVELNTVSLSYSPFDHCHVYVTAMAFPDVRPNMKSVCRFAVGVATSGPAVVTVKSGAFGAAGTDHVSSAAWRSATGVLRPAGVVAGL